MYARVIEDSIWNDVRLTTMEVRAPKFLDAEFRTHGQMAQNCSSSRAVPVERTVENGIFFPTDIRLAEKGMQGYEKLRDVDGFHADLKYLYEEIANFTGRWDVVHKQHINRYLEPFSYQFRLMTSYDEGWANFFRLRLAEDVDPAMQQIARMMKDAYDISTPIEKNRHIPYNTDDMDVSAARCARISYTNHGTKKIDEEADRRLAETLKRNCHWTPLEHQCVAMCFSGDKKGWTHQTVDGRWWSGRFPLWVQYRKLMEGQ